MKYSIVFSSRTGNTEQLAEALKKTLPQVDCEYFGTPGERALETPLIFVGFWTDKGCCDESTKKFLQTLKNKKIFLFGTAGFGGNESYFERILDSIKINLDVSVTVEGSFMCQGKMPVTVLERYEKMLSDAADPASVNGMIDNFHKAATHPNQTDFENLNRTVSDVIRSETNEKRS